MKRPKMIRIITLLTPTAPLVLPISDIVLDDRVIVHWYDMSIGVCTRTVYFNAVSRNGELVWEQE